MVDLSTRIKWPAGFVKNSNDTDPEVIWYGTKMCSEFRKINLIPHAAKILLRVLNRRLIRIMEIR